MKRREWLAAAATLSSVAAFGSLTGCAAPVLRGTGDLGVVIGRANGTLYLVDTSTRALIGEVPGLGDLSHASVVFSRDGRYAYVFGRDGGLTMVDLLTQRITHRVMQAGNSIGGAISADGTLVAAQNYTPGGVKVFDARTLELVADIPAEYAPGKPETERRAAPSSGEIPLGGPASEGAGGLQRSRVVGLVDLPGRRFAYSLFDADAIWVTDCSDPKRVTTHKFDAIGRQPYDALVTPDGRHYIAGLFGEDGLAMLDLWADQPKVRRILGGYGKGQESLPVYKMPHLRGWAVAGRRAYLPAIGRHEVLVVDTDSWQEVGRIPVAGQPVFVMARPDGRQVWVNFAVPDYHRVQVIDTQRQQIVQTLEPGKAVLHMEFTPRGDAVWISSRDENRVSVVDTQSFATRARLDVPAPSGIFFTSRAARMGF
ncbi:MAG: cytochrome D1 domain-containing protein [Hydrogenophaga sp.]|uniref:cytochrome D1 domain-containing protein n=1 Tax=Hydrogenophaga sp. TaxID=1904254 RepID=UPI003D9BEE35